MTYTVLREVVALLPFHLDDTVQVNEAFARWRRHHRACDKRLVDVWTYCYVYRYFLVKFTSVVRQTPLAFDRLVATAFADVQSNLQDVRRPECYAGWVGTICRNTFVNYLRTRRSMVALDDEKPTLVVEQTRPAEDRDAVLLQSSIEQAIAALPAFLRDVARMRLVEHRSYRAIQQATGRPLPTLRTYVNKALEQLRRNTRLRALFEEIQG